MPALTYRDPTPSPFLIRTLGMVNRYLVLPHVARVKRIDLPEADAARLRFALNRDTAAFLAPAHPEFMTDWMIDKELSHRFSPLMASWAAADIVNASPLAQKFWLANGLIANTPGGGGKAYSARVAKEGHGVLLHPEGMVSWQAERVGRLHAGAIDMAVQLTRKLDAAAQNRPVFVVPMAWRLAFTGDASRGLVREMDLIERECGVPRGRASNPAERFATMLGALLIERARALCLGRPDVSDAASPAGYFDAHAAVVAAIRARLASSYGPLNDDPALALRTLHRGIRRRANTHPGDAAHDRELVTELRRLTHIDPQLYGRDTITQEQIAEVLKATRQVLVRRGLRHTLHNLIPRSVAPRVAHMRVADPIDVRAALLDGATSDTLGARLHRALQQKVDAIGEELAPAAAARNLRNPLARQTSNGYEASRRNWTWNNRAS